MYIKEYEQTLNACQIDGLFTLLNEIKAEAKEDIQDKSGDALIVTHAAGRSSAATMISNYLMHTLGLK
jgi:hypothetical protein